MRFARTQASAPDAHASATSVHACVKAVAFVSQAILLAVHPARVSQPVSHQLRRMKPGS